MSSPIALHSSEDSLATRELARCRSPIERRRHRAVAESTLKMCTAYGTDVNTPSRFTGAGGLMECSTSITAKRRDVIYRVFGQNGRLVNTGDDVREGVSALRRDS